MNVFNAFIIVCCFLNGAIICSKLATECGKNGLSFNSTTWKIVGGQVVRKGEFPWQALLQREYTEQGTKYIGKCGGSIINEYWILTAAHCLEGSKTNEFTVILGEHKISVIEGTEVPRKVSKIIYDGEYNGNTITNDLGLIKLTEPLDFANKHSHLKPICLSSAVNEVTTNCYVTGWGDTNGYSGIDSDILLKVSEPIYNMTLCSRILPDIDSKLNVCAGGNIRGGTGACRGDSGGPLQCYGSDGKWYQLGVVSKGVTPCASPGVPDVFTRVSAYRTWIEAVIDKY